MHPPLSNPLMFMGNLSDEESRTAMQYFQRAKLLQGQRLCEAGEMGNEMFILETGRIAVVMDTEIAMIPMGMPFGEISLLDGMPRSAACVADTDCTVLRISREQLMRLRTEHPVVAAKIYEGIAATLARRLRYSTDKLAQTWR